MRPLLNVDAGELPTETAELWALFDVLACACGGHAGDAASMARVAAFCASAGVRLAAHPSYPDPGGFGRTAFAIDPAALQRSIEDQCGTLVGIARAAGVEVTGVKPHGALYHEAARDAAIAAAVLAAVAPGMFLIGPPRGALRELAERRGVPYLREGFADRRMRPDGSLVPRTDPDALITSPEEAARQAQALRDVDTICVHGDSPGAIVIARAVREAIHG